MTVEELLARTTSQELAEWMVYERLDPFGLVRGDIQAATIAAVIAEVNRDPKKRSKPYEPQDFVPAFSDDDDKEPDPLDFVRAVNRVLGGKEAKA